MGWKRGRWPLPVGQAGAHCACPPRIPAAGIRRAPRARFAAPAREWTRHHPRPPPEASPGISPSHGRHRRGVRQAAAMPLYVCARSGLVPSVATRCRIRRARPGQSMARRSAGRAAVPRSRLSIGRACLPWRSPVGSGEPGPAILGRAFGRPRGSAAQAACLTPSGGGGRGGAAGARVRRGCRSGWWKGWRGPAAVAARAGRRRG